MSNAVNAEAICKILEVESLDVLEQAPLYVVVELSAKCNAKCIMCPRNTEPPDRDGMLMPVHIRQKVIRDLRGMAPYIRRVMPQCDGEPLCDPHLHVFIKQLKEIGIDKVFMSTNASLLTEERARQLLENGLDQCDISLDACTAETYEYIRPGLNFETVTNNIRQMFALRNALGAKTAIRLRYVIQDCNKYEITAFKQYWGQFITPTDSMSFKEIHTYGGQIKDKFTEDYLNDFEKCIKTPCHHPFGTLTIWADGTVPFCTYDMRRQYPAANVLQQDLASIWKGNVFSDMRNKHIRQGRAGVELCSGCNATDPQLKLS